MDLHRGRLLDIALGRSGSVVETWLARRDDDWLTGIDVLALDPFRGYANACPPSWGHATVVLDHFHAIRLANAAVDDLRRRVQQEVLGHGGRKGDPLYGIRRLLLVAAERLSERGRVRIAAGLAAGDRFDEVGAAWDGQELLRAVYAAGDVLAARRALVALYQWCNRGPGPRSEPAGHLRSEFAKLLWNLLRVEVIRLPDGPQADLAASLARDLREGSPGLPK